MGSLTKAELTEQLMEAVDLNKADAKTLVESFFHEIKVCLGNDEDVKISSFGNFELKEKVARPGRNPKTGEEVPVSARKVVTFKPGQKLRYQIDTSPYLRAELEVVEQD